MDNKIIIQLIKREINELTLLVDAMENTTVPGDILIDVTKSKAETLSEVVNFLHKDTYYEPVLDDHNPENKSENDIIQSLVEKKEEHEEMPAPEPKPLNNKEKETINTPTDQPESSIDEYSEPIEDKEHNSHKKVLGDQFTKEKSLNEKFTSLTETKYKVMGKPVTSVKKAIGLNDRFMFTRELFNNDSGKFNDTVEAIDNANDLVEAIEYLEKNCEWPKNETSLKFMDLVKRRFNN
ncbi:MAG TPA: hypothetical protein VJ909_07780 [Prolixibacteraceae bacterium]|nr:hypothetical protein [Prolixibacteraceae bacterium]